MTDFSVSNASSYLRAPAPISADLPVRDRDTAIKLAAGMPELADELLAHFLASLPESLAQIEAAHLDQDPHALTQAVHRLHGACCYCGVPRLKLAVYTFEDNLVRDPEINTTPFFMQVKEEIELLLALE